MTDETKFLELLSEARLTLDRAIERIRAGESLGTLSEATLQRLGAREDLNTSCVNTGCGKASLAQAQAER